MKLLSIDLEACNIYLKGSVFSIGVVLADEQFNVLLKKNFVINPQCKFAMKFRKPIDFHMEKEFILSQPTIRDRYQEIAELFTSDTMVVAHSAMNDVLMLNAALKRAGLSSINYSFICSQVVYSAMHNLQNGIGLDKVAEEMQMEFNHHQADDDAEVALEIIKHAAATYNTNLEGLISKLGITPGKVENFIVTPIRCKMLNQQKVERKKKRQQRYAALTAESKQPGCVRMRLDAVYFEQIVSGHKTVEVRLNDAKRKKLNVGDFIYLVKNSSTPDIIKVKLINKMEFATFEELYFNYPPTAFGIKCDSADEFATIMHLFYSYEDLEKYGAVALEVAVVE